MRLLPSTALLAPLLCAPALGDQVILEPSKDNTLYSDTSGNTSNGMGEFFFVGRNGGMAAFPIRRGLLAFDVAAALPAGAKITAVRLDLNMSMTISGPSNLTLHPALQDWGEGASDAPGSEGAGAASAPGDATWKHTFYATSFWNTPGGDFGAASASTSVDQAGPYSWGPTPEMVADVQTWVSDPAQNFGWLMHGKESTSTTAKRFDSRNSLFPSLRPKLVIDFVPPPPPTAYCTSKTTSSGCTPSIASSGLPSASSGSGFVISTTQVEPGNLGIFFYGQSGPASIAFQGAYLCVQPPTLRTPASSSGSGGACGGTYAIDFNDHIANGPDPSLIAGAAVHLQTWFRDPPNPSFGTGLSNGLEFTIAP